VSVCVCVCVFVCVCVCVFASLLTFCTFVVPILGCHWARFFMCCAKVYPSGVVK
jgi:hypothetical protein